MSEDGMVSVPLSWSERHEEVKAENARLRAAIKAHHFDVAHTASKGIGVRASDHALYREAGLPDVGEADKETGAEFIARMEQIVAERDRLRAVVEKAKEFVAARARWHAEVERSSAVPPVEFQRDYDDTQMALVDAVGQLDGTGITGGEADDVETDRARADDGDPGGGPRPRPGPPGSGLSERDLALADVGRAALRASKAGVHVSLRYETGQWTIGGDESSAGGAATDDGHVLGEPDPEDGFRPVYTHGGEHVGWSAPGSPPHIVPIGDEPSAGGASTAPADRGAGPHAPGAPSSWAEYMATVSYCPGCGGTGCDECGGTGEALYGPDENPTGGTTDA